MKSNSTVSVIVPVFNTEKYLQAALDSLFKQTLKDIEIICVNDGSTDSSRQILEENKDRIQIVDKENGGLSSARNAGLLRAQGKYVYFFDSDDLLMPDALETLYLQSEKNELDILHFEWVRFFDDEDAKQHFNGNTQDSLNGIYNQVYENGELFAQKVGNDDFRSSACLRFFRKEFLDRESLTFLEGIVHEDELFAVLCDVHAKRVMHCPHKFFHRRVRSNSIMTAKNTNHLHAACRFIVAATLLEHFEKQQNIADAVLEKVRKRIEIVLNAALWDYIHLEDNQKILVREEFQKKTGLACEVFLHICEYAFQRGCIQKNKLESQLNEYQEKLSSIENKLAYESKILSDPEKKLGDGCVAVGKMEENDTAPLISVIIPVFNMEKYLGESLRSVISQTLQNIEIICVDDGSKDASVSVLKGFAANDSRIRIFQQPNSGVAAARNLGMLHAKGKFLAFLDPDDMYPEEKTLEKLYHAAVDNDVLIAGGSVCWLENGVIQEHPERGFGEMVFETSGKRSYADYQYDYGFWRFIYNRELVQKNNIVFPPYRRFQDPPFMVATFAAAGDFYVLKEPVYVYRANYRKQDVSAMPIDKVLDIYSGNLDVIRIAKAYSLNRFHQRVFKRINCELHEISYSAVYNGNRAVFDKLMAIQKELDPQFLEEEDSLLIPLKRIFESCTNNNRLIFSIIIPVYKTEQYLEQCINALRRQTVRKFEVIFVDDGSNGNCEQIVADSYDSRFRYIRHEENRGLLAARITGARHAQGEFLVHLDPDDTYEPHLLQNLLNVINACSDVDIITYWANIIEGDKKSAFWANNPTETVVGKEIFSRLINGKQYWTIWGKCIRRSLYIKAVDALDLPQDLNLTNTEDLLQFLPIAYFARKMVSIEYPGYNYFKNPQSVTMNVTQMDKWTRCFTNVYNSWKYLCRFAEAQHVTEEELCRIRNLQKGVIEWGLKLIDPMPAKDWNEHFTVLHDCCYQSYLYNIICSKYMSHFYDLDLSSVKLPTVPDRKIQTVAVLSDTMAGGGAERATAVLIRNFVENGYRVVLFNGYEPKSNEYDFPSVPRYILPESYSVERWDMLQKKCQEHQVDCAILIGHLHLRAYIDLICLKMTGCRIVMQEHSAYLYPLIDSAYYTNFFYRKPFYKIADVLTCLSDYNVKWWQTAGVSQTVYMPNFLTFKCDENVAQSSLSSSDLLFVGRISRLKGAFKAVDMMKFLITKQPEAKLYMLGRFVTEKEEKEFRDHVAARGVENNVEIVGSVTDVAAYFKKAAALVMCSRVEGAPMVLFEAKAYGVPTVLFDLPYVDSTTPEEGVVSVPQDDVKAMADRLAELLGEDRTELQKLGALAKKSLTRFTDAVIMEQWKALFAKLESGIPLEAAPVDPLLKVTMNEFEMTIRGMSARIEEGLGKIGHNQWLTSELTKAKGHGDYLSAELTHMTGHAQYLSAELTKAQGHGQYLSAELLKAQGNEQYLSAELTKAQAYYESLEAELAVYKRYFLVRLVKKFCRIPAKLKSIFMRGR